MSVAPWTIRRRLILACLIVAGLPALAHSQPVTLSIDAPDSLAAAADRIRRIDFASFARTLSTAGLPMPGEIDIALIARGDSRTAAIPGWVVGLAAGTRHVIIFPDRIGPYPHDSLETVVRHEVVHLALNSAAGGRPLPRWFHEGVAVTTESGWGARDEMRLLLAALDPPSIADLQRLFASEAYPDTTQAYLLSAALVEEIQRRHGRDVAGEIARRVASGLSFDAAFRAATGESSDAAADRAWQNYRRVSRWFLVATNPSTVWSFILLLAAMAFALRLRRSRQLRRRWAAEEEQEREASEDDYWRGN